MNKNNTIIIAGFLIIMGSLLLLRNLNIWDFPVFHVLVSLGLIVLGVKLINKTKSGQQATTFMAEDEQRIHDQTGMQRFDVIFGSKRLWLDQIQQGGNQIHVSVVFGSCTLYIPKNTPYAVSGSVSFGEIKDQGFNKGNFGRTAYVSGSGESTPVVHLMVHVLFGELEIIAC